MGGRKTKDSVQKGDPIRGEESSMPGKEKDRLKCFFEHVRHE